MSADDERSVRAALDTLDDDGGVVVETGSAYRDHDPVRVRIRHRANRYDIDDDGAAVARAGRPAGWLADAGRLVASEGFNVNRRGVISVPAVEGRDIPALARRLAATARTVYLTLLERQG